MKSPNAKTRYGSFVLYLVFCIFLIMIPACGSSTSDSDDSSSDTGSIAFSLVWEEPTGQSSTRTAQSVYPFQQVPTVCTDYGITTVRGDVYDSSNDIVASAEEPCEKGEMTFTNVPPGTVWVLLEGKVGNTVEWRGQVTNIEVHSGAHSDAGTVTMVNIVNDPDPPQVQPIVPAGDATDVPLNITITARFNEDVYAATVNSSTCVLETGGAPVQCTVTYYSSINTVSIDPVSQLSQDAVYTVTITTGVQDLAGNPMAVDEVWIFTTGAVINEIPTATITSPSDGSVFTSGDSITFTGSGSDPEDGNLTGSSLGWTSSIDGPIGTGTSFATNTLSVGTHTITLTATDSYGATDTDSITLTILNNPPTATITSPSDGSVFTSGDSITFTGSGSDPEDGNLTGSSLGWTSSIDGPIGTGTSFATNTLSVGTHTITLTATDSDGASGSASITVTVTLPVLRWDTGRWDEAVWD